MKKYKYEEIITNQKNFIKRYVDFASTQTDAPHVFHEGYAISMLGIASHGLLLSSANNPRGQALNSYFLMHGSSAISRKSTCQRIAMDLLILGLQHGFGQSDDFTPEGLMDALKRNDGRPMVVYMDEFTTMLDRLMKQSMSGLKPLILKFLNSRFHVYTRVSKGPSKKKEVDEIVIENGHLSIVGNITPSITQRITEFDVDDGFLGRFLIVAPEGKPEPMQATVMNKKQAVMKQELVMQLSAIAQGCQLCREYAVANPGAPTIIIEPSAQNELWEFQKKVERLERKLTPTQFILIQRIPEYSIKLSCQVSLGQFDPQALANGPLIVDKDDAQNGIKLANRYMNFAKALATDIGSSKEDAKVIRIINYIENSSEQKLPKRTICRNLNITAKEAREIEATLILREQISVDLVKSDNSKKFTEYWCLSNGSGPTVSPAPGARLEDNHLTGPKPGEN